MRIRVILIVTTLAGAGCSLVRPANEAIVLGSTKPLILVARDTTFEEPIPEPTPGMVIPQIQYDDYLPELPKGWPQHVGRDLMIREKAELSERDNPSDFDASLYLGAAVAQLVNNAVTFWNIYTACDQYSTGVANKIQCLYGAISTIIALSISGYRVYIWTGQLRTFLTNNGFRIRGISDPYKRDEILSLMEREFTRMLKTEVKHLGVWDVTDPDQDRDDTFDLTQPREVFGANVGGFDYHFTYMGRDESTHMDMFKLGVGPGSDPSTASERRQDVFMYNDYYFTDGGLDFTIQAVESSSAPEWAWESTADASEFNDIMRSVSCYFGGLFSLSLIASPGIYFEVYDSSATQTLAAGSIAPFTNDTASNIANMFPRGNVGVLKACQAF
ncbi:hypothetical protein BX600DRAFT_517881 [Xylariales sp. PMI_506]|nr:hypothetical protein BX600DRAFT_517881 [Xylariales sp. PMI_506]